MADGKELFQVKGIVLKLGEQSGECVVDYTRGQLSGQVATGLDAPCRWVADSKGAPRSHTYRDARNATVLVVIGGIGDPRSADPLVKQGCGTQTRALLLRTDGLSVSSRVVREGVWCPSGVDEKEFWIFSH